MRTFRIAVLRDFPIALLPANRTDRARERELGIAVSDDQSRIRHTISASILILTVGPEVDHQERPA